MDERRAWNDWNTQSNREHGIGHVQRAQADHIERWLRESAHPPLRILEVGCGTGWMVERLAAYGPVTGIDLADEVIERARERLAHLPGVTLAAGDFLDTDLGDPGSYDVVVSIETMAHFRDQDAFLRRIAQLLSPQGLLMLAVLNRPMMERHFDVRELFSTTPKFFDGPLHILNSERVEELAGRVALGRPLRAIKHWEERHFLGFSLMCLAAKDRESQSAAA